jgi:hypothetical protein
MTMDAFRNHGQVAKSGGYHFGFTLLVVVGAYVALLLAYVCYRRAAQKVRVARVKTQNRSCS